MISWDELRPASGSKKKVQMTFKGLDKQPITKMLDFNFDKDAESSTGNGRYSLLYYHEDYLKIKKYSEFLIKVGWQYSNGKTILKEFCSGFIKDISRSGHELQLELVDKGVLLEANGYVSFTQKKRSYIIKQIIKMAGLIANVDFTGVTDDVIDFSSASSGDSVAGGVTGIGTPSCGNCKKLGYKEGSWYQTVAENKCPACGKSGTIVYIRNAANNICGHDDNPMSEGHYICCSAKKDANGKKGCDADFCVVCGTDHGKYSRKINLLQAATSTSDPGLNTSVDGSGTVKTDETKNADGTTKTTTDSTDTSTDTEAKQDSTRSYWDMLLELTDPVGHDLEIFVWMDTCYVRKVKREDTAVLQIDGSKNVIKDSVSIAEGEPYLVNTLDVLYGESKRPNVVTVQEARLVEKYGVIKGDPIKAYKSSLSEATSIGYSELNRIIRDDGFSIDCTIFGHPEYYICRWTTFISKKYHLEDYYYITRLSMSAGASEQLKAQLTLMDYRPTITSESKAEVNQGTMEGIIRQAAKFKYLRGQSDPSLLPSKGGDCWAMSAWLYEHLTAAGVRCRVVQYHTNESARHRTVQLYKGSDVWADLDYRGYGFSMMFRNTTSKPGMFVQAGG